jgi:hypothetical protein
MKISIPPSSRRSRMEPQGGERHRWASRRPKEREASESKLSEFLIQTFFIVLLIPAFFAPTATAGERSVTGAEATGTYRDAKSSSEIRILALGHGKLKVQLALVYEFKSDAGPMANLGDASGEATIENDVAVFVPEGFDACKITMTFLPNGKLKVEQQGEECGFGHNVYANGTFRKISSQKPKFDDA